MLVLGVVLRGSHGAENRTVVSGGGDSQRKKLTFGKPNNPTKRARTQMVGPKKTKKKRKKKEEKEETRRQGDKEAGRQGRQGIRE